MPKSKTALAARLTEAIQRHHSDAMRHQRLLGPHPLSTKTGRATLQRIVRAENSMAKALADLRALAILLSGADVDEKGV